MVTVKYKEDLTEHFNTFPNEKKKKQQPHSMYFISCCFFDFTTLKLLDHFLWKLSSEWLCYPKCE